MKGINLRILRNPNGQAGKKKRHTYLKKKKTRDKGKILQSAKGVGKWEIIF